MGIVYRMAIFFAVKIPRTLPGKIYRDFKSRSGVYLLSDIITGKLKNFNIVSNFVFYRIQNISNFKEKEMVNI